MTDETGAPVGGEAVAVDTPAQDTGGSLTISEAARLLSQSRYKDKDTPAESAEPATAEPELAQADADPETAPSEATEEAEPAELPPIEPPRSWTKEEKEEFKSYPREAQERISKAATRYESEFRRSQNEIAETRKAVEAERAAVEKARKEYEAKLPNLMQTLQEAGPFGDIRTMADVEKLQAEDPFRFQAYQVHQWKLQAAQQELAEARTKQEQEQQTQWAQHVQKENTLAAEHIPELADKEKGPALVNRVANEILPEYGFTPSELADMASGKSKLSIYDHRVQRLLATAVKYADIQKAKTAVATKPVPPVQRPGTSKPAGSTVSAQIQALQEKFNRTGSLKDAQALHAAEMRRRA